MNQLSYSESKLVISIVSHGQLQLIKNLLFDIRESITDDYKIILTINIPEDEACLSDFADLPIFILRNRCALGFGANHNQAFSNHPCVFFLVVNPDIRLNGFNLHILLQNFSRSDVGAIAPRVLSSAGKIEDNARKFPTFMRLLKRFFLRIRENDYLLIAPSFSVDWCAGMFVAFRGSAFRQASGFDNRYFMYMEDADICRRLKKLHWQVLLEPNTCVIHDAQRASHNSFWHFIWHLKSAFRFLFLSEKKSQRST